MRKRTVNTSTEKRRNRESFPLQREFISLAPSEDDDLIEKRLLEGASAFENMQESGITRTVIGDVQGND
jgi:hypothetical protein